MRINYSPITTESTRQTFYSYIDCLDIPQIDYVAIGIQNVANKTSMSLMSNAEWQSYFMAEQYAKYDPLRKATLQTCRNIISFDEIDHIDSFGKEIMRQRTRYDIKRGVVIMQRHQKHNFMLTLGTSFTHFKSYKFLNRHHESIERIKQHLIKIIEKDSFLFLPSATIVDPSSDAR